MSNKNLIYGDFSSVLWEYRYMYNYSESEIKSIKMFIVIF